MKGLEQEKQVVAALKRLSIGHLMNHDPDLPVLGADLHLFDPEHHDDSTLSGDSLSLSKTPSPQTSDSNVLAHVSAKDSSVVPDSYSGNTHRRSASIDQEFVDAQSDHPEMLDAELLWLPANLHPEVNPQQFKSHVKSTIDELLERKLSRSKSVKNSKRSSLSLSTTDQDQLAESIGRSSPGKDQDLDNSKRFSNPSLRELSTELEALSRMAGMDANDAVTLARSLSTSSLGYTDVEKLAFDELNIPNHISPTSNQAELLDLGVDETSPTSHKTYVMPKQTMGHAPQFQGYPQQPRQRRASPSNWLPRQLSQDSSSSLGIHHQLSTEDFGLKRSRRLDYRKGPTTTPTHLGSQLQNHKAGKLAELRHNLSATSSPITGSTGDFLGVQNSSRSSRLSIQSINPRSSQLLFSYKSPSGSSSPKGSHSPASRESQSAPMRTVKDSPYGHAATSASASIENQLYHTKYGNQNPKHLSSMSSKHRGYKTYQGEKERQPRKVSPSTAYPLDSRRASQSSQSPQVPHLLRPRNVSPRNPNAPYQYQGQPQSMGPSQNVPQQQPRYMRSNSQLLLQLKTLSGAPVAGQPVVRRQYSEDDQSSPFYSSKSSLSKRDKSKELNQNLDLLRNEINEFKESLSKSEPKPDSAKITAKEVTPAKQPVETNQETPDFSFDLSSHEVSYEDSLGIELDVLKELNNAKQQPSPRSSPSSSPGSSPRTSPKKTPPAINVTTEEPSQSPLQPSGPQSVPSDSPIETTKDLTLGQPSNAKKDEVSLLKLRDNVEDIPREQDSNSEQNESEVQVEADLRMKFSRTKLEEVPKETLERVETAPTKIDSVIKKKKSLGSLANRTDSDKKKTGKKGWLWSRQRSVSASSPTEEKIKTTPARSVSSPGISSMKREHPKKEESVKDNVITKLFKKKRNSVSSEQLASQTSPRSLFSEKVEAADSTDIASRISAKSSNSRESRETIEVKSDSQKLKLDENNNNSKNDETVTSRIKNKIKQIGKGHEEKTEPLVEDTISEVEEEDQEEGKPQSTLEVQEKLRKTIRRASKPNQPIEFTDSAFGFPLPPPSHSTLVMIDYRFPVHVERAIYRLSHLKLANPKRSLREQVLLSNFMYAYLNLVDHTLHLEQQMELEENLEQPDNDMDMFTPDDVDTEFGTDDDLDEGTFDSIKLDLDVQGTQKIKT